jgi:hypothetical protein
VYFLSRYLPQLNRVSLRPVSPRGPHSMYSFFRISAQVPQRYLLNMPQVPSSAARLRLKHDGRPGYFPNANYAELSGKIVLAKLRIALAHCHAAATTKNPARRSRNIQCAERSFLRAHFHALDLALTGSLKEQIDQKTSEVSLLLAQLRGSITDPTLPPILIS